MHAVILAGGLGTRLRPVVNDRPKPLAEIRGRPFLAWLLDHWITQGVDQVVLSVGYRWQMIREAFRDRYRGIPLHYAVEQAPLGTGGGLLNACARLDPTSEPILVANGDTFFAVELAALQATHREHQAAATLACHWLPTTGRYGALELAPSGRVQGLTSAPQNQAHAGWVNGGIYLVEPALLNTPPRACSLEADLVPQWLADDHHLQACPSDAYFIDIGVPDDYARAQSTLQTEVTP